MKDGLRSQCKSCDYSANTSWVAKNLEHVKTERVRYYASNKDKSRVAGRAWAAKNPDKSSAYQKKAYWGDPAKARQARACWLDKNREVAYAGTAKWRCEHPEQAKALSAAWKKANAGKVRESASKRRAKEAAPKWSCRKAVAELYKKALQLSASTGVRWSVDHIYPLQGKSVSGLHTQSNLRIIPLSVNAAKRNKLPGHLAHELWDPAGLDVFHA